MEKTTLSANWVLMMFKWFTSSKLDCELMYELLMSSSVKLKNGGQVREMKGANVRSCHAAVPRMRIMRVMVRPFDSGFQG